jgi:NodT family efflux transporter outer membrane factor (OMF) lipoprotein
MLKNWWVIFADNELNHLLDRAMSGNFDLKIALARIDQARAGLGSAQAARQPGLGLDSGVQRNQNPFPGLAPGLRYNQFQLGFDAVWELDLFGGLQRRAESAEADLAASREQYRQARLILTAELARDYVEYRNLQQQLRINRAYLQAQQQNLFLTEKLLEAGVATRADWLRSRSQTDDTAARIPDLEAQLAVLLSQLEVLTGDQPGVLAVELNEPVDIPLAHGQALLLSPAETLRGRPDIRTVERRLASATALQGAAMAELYPKLSLSAFLGMRNTDLESLFKSAAFSYTTAAGLLQPALNFGKIRAAINSAESRQQQAYLEYEKAVMTALQETETAITGYLKAEIRRKTLADSVTNLQESLTISQRRMQQGVASRLDVLDAERNLYTAQAELAQSAAKSATQLIAVYKALGGSATDDLGG